MNKKLDFNQLSREALNEMLEAVEHCISYRKKEYEQWTDSTFPGCLGIPAAILLFSIADAIGSHYRHKEFKIRGKDKMQKMKNTDEHFFIFNSELYDNQLFSREEITVLYDIYRSKLTHNLGLPSFHFMELNTESNNLLEKKQSNQNENYWVLNLHAFSSLTKKAVEAFLLNSEPIIGNSHIAKMDVGKKDLSIFGEVDEINKIYNSAYNSDYVSPSGTNCTLPPSSSNY